jgi:hypothetical protein
LGYAVRQIMGRLLLFAFLVLASADVVACKCPNISLAEQFQRAPIAFIGTTSSDPSHPAKIGSTISFLVGRALKGTVSPGTTVTVDPMFGSDCTAPFRSGVRLLVFAYPQASGSPIVSACGVRATEPMQFGAKLVQPSPKVLEFLQSIP